LPLVVWLKHGEPRYAKVLLSEERKDADFMVELREAGHQKEIRMPSSMENIQPKRKRMKKEGREDS